MMEITSLLKRSLFIPLLLPLLLSQHARASETLYTSPEIDVVWEPAARLSADDLTRYRRRGLELANFYREQVLPQIPAALWPERTPPALTVRFRADLPTDGGLFVPPTTERGSTSIRVARVSVNIAAALIQNGDAERTLGHEYFHALHWILHPDEPTWLREGLAQVFETRLYRRGKFNTNNLVAGFGEIATSLEGEMRVDAISAAQYGHVLLYFWYLYGRCGGEDLFWALVKPEDGLFGEKTVEYALKKTRIAKPGCRDFHESFVEFELARAINQRALDGADPERWFLVDSALAKAKTESRLPDAARWARTSPWTPILANASADKLDPKVLPGARAYWLVPGSTPRAIEGFTRPSPKATRVLILRLP